MFSAADNPSLVNDRQAALLRSAADARLARVARRARREARRAVRSVEPRAEVRSLAPAPSAGPDVARAVGHEHRPAA